MSLADLDAKIQVYQFLVDSIPKWINAIDKILDGTSQRVLKDENGSRSSSQVTPGLSAQEDTTVELSSIEPAAPSTFNQLHYLPTSSSNQQNTALRPQQNRAHSHQHKRKRSNSPSPSERSGKMNKYRAQNAIKVIYDGDAQIELEQIVKGTERCAYDMRKRKDEAVHLHLSEEEIKDRDVVLTAVKDTADRCYSAAFQLLRDGTCDAQLQPAKADLTSAKGLIDRALLADKRSSRRAALEKPPVPPQPEKPSDSVDVDLDSDDEDELIMSRMALRLTSRMGKT